MSRDGSRRVLLALESSGPGGAENMVLRLAEALREIGDEPIVASMLPGWMTERAEQAGIPVWILPQRPGYDPTWIVSLAKRLRSEQIDVVHTHEFAMNIYAGIAARMLRLPTIATIHGKRWVAERSRRILAYRALRRIGMRIVAVSEDLAVYLSDELGIPRSELALVYNGIPVPTTLPGNQREDARASLPLPLDGKLVVAVGNLYPVKDHATLLRAIAGRDEHLRVAIAGRGEQEEELRELAHQLHIEDRVHLLGLRDDVSRVLAAADCFVQCSRSEGLPLAVLEAMAAGLPIVATRVGGLAEALGPGPAGILVPPGDPDALGEAVGQLAASDERAKRLGAAAYMRVREVFSVETMCQRYRGLYGDT